MNSEQATAHVVRLREELGWIPTAEDVVIQKLRWARRKDLDDVQNVIAVSGQRFDWDYINEWTIRHGTNELLNEIRASIPDMEFLDEQE